MLKPVDELTDQERFAICLAAGVEFEMKLDVARWTHVFRSKREVGIKIVNGRYHVAIGQPLDVREKG